MSLGNNRDYKSADRRARTQLAKHAEIMDWFISKGDDRELASTKAFRAMQDGLDLARLKEMAIDRSGQEDEVRRLRKQNAELVDALNILYRASLDAQIAAGAVGGSVGTLGRQNKEVVVMWSIAHKETREMLAKVCGEPVVPRP